MENRVPGYHPAVDHLPLKACHQDDFFLQRFSNVIVDRETHQNFYTLFKVTFRHFRLTYIREYGKNSVTLETPSIKKRQYSISYEY